VVDADGDVQHNRLGEAGFDAVLVKPFLFSDIERLLAA
jgi:hypothetical protein